MMQKVRGLVALVAGLVLILAASPGAAQSQDKTGSGLSISPTVSEFTINPGESNKVTITLKNITVDDVVAKAFVLDFESDNTTGNPRIITDPNKQSAHSIRNFVQGLADVPIAKGQQTKVDLGLNIPQNTPPGAYYGIIRYKAVPASAANNNQPGEVALTASVGTIVLITVPGNLREQVQLTGLHVYVKDHEHTFFTQKPNQVGVQVKNLGNGFAQPFGTVEVRNMFGKQVSSYQLNNNQPRSNVLPGSSRTFKNDLSGISQIGRYTITASVAYGSGSYVLVGKKTFWYIPAWLIIIILLVLVALVLLATRSYWLHRRGLRHPRRKR